MLQKLSDHIAGCIERARRAEERAAGVGFPEMKADYEEIAKAWRHLASSYQFAEALERFLLDIERAKKVEPAPPSAPP